MADSGSQGKWEISRLSDGDIQELKRSGYLATNITHRAPEKGKVVPTPRPGERMLFARHFIRGVGFPLHPFVRGLIARINGLGPSRNSEISN
ncbi:Wall-associated receptor kinase 3 [Hordeum vulgare]|nr:Wall-associated receptor kinase 3 [Hordeum vulgare]